MIKVSKIEKSISSEQTWGRRYNNILDESSADVQDETGEEIIGTNKNSSNFNTVMIEKRIIVTEI